MPTDIDSESWSGDGDFTQKLVDWFSAHAAIAFVRVEDAPSTRADFGYNFISNEIFIGFRTGARVERLRFWGFVPVRRTAAEKLMTLERLESVLAEAEEIGPADYVDEGMFQYLRTERIIPPYQAKGYKLIELVRIFEAGTVPRR
jgi:hypothetical protein